MLSDLALHRTCDILFALSRYNYIRYKAFQVGVVYVIQVKDCFNLFLLAYMLLNSLTIEDNITSLTVCYYRIIPAAQCKCCSSTVYCWEGGWTCSL